MEQALLDHLHGQVDFDRLVKGLSLVWVDQIFIALGLSISGFFLMNINRLDTKTAFEF